MIEFIDFIGFIGIIGFIDCFLYKAVPRIAIRAFAQKLWALVPALLADKNRGILAHMQSLSQMIK